jgi:hypothetical protein
VFPLRHSHRNGVRVRAPEFPCGRLRASEPNSEREQKPSPRPISTGRLNTLPCLHLRPIYLVVSEGPYSIKDGRPHLGASFALRCLQRLSLPHVANQPCRWRDNWHTRGASAPVLSYWGQLPSSLLRPRRIGTDTFVTAGRLWPGARTFLPGSACRHAGRTISSPPFVTAGVRRMVSEDSGYLHPMQGPAFPAD